MRLSYAGMIMHKNGKKIHKMQKIILHWAKNNFKKYPWRLVSDPYKILISELLLQKTDARKIEQVYPKFVGKFPTILDLCQADIEELKKLIKDIGLLYRAKRFKKIAEQIVDEFNGNVPNSKKELISLCGVGEYISNAVLCFAFEKRVPIVDTNVIRVYERVFNLKSSKSRPRTDQKIWSFAEEILPKKKYVEYNYAILDFASDICKIKNPACEICQVKKICRYYTA